MPNDGKEAEWLTRKLRIDTRLRALNPQWQIIPWRDGLDTSKLTCHAVTEFPTENGPADYALFVDGMLLGIIEAKKVTVSPQNVLEQAKRYSRGAANGPGNWNGFRGPFLYAKLTPSLLARAFAGQLVPQNAADKPAQKLLEHIKKSIME
jgi:type I restriction enzyme, R subunit